MCGGICTLTCDTIPTLATASTVALKVLGGDSICVSDSRLLNHNLSLTNMFALSAVVLSERLVENVKLCEIRSDIYGASDHCPIVLEIEGIF